MVFDNKIIYLTYSDLALKAVVVSHSSGKPKVIFSDQRSLGAGIVFDERIADLVKFKEEVRRFLEDNQKNFKSRQIIVGINEQDGFFSSFQSQDQSKNIESSISKSLTPSLPFNVSEANISYKQLRSSTYQLVALRNSLLLDLSSIFASLDLKVLGFIPIPVAVLNLVTNTSEPYIYIFFEDSVLVFALVSQNTIVFSTTLKLNNEIKNSTKEILKVVGEILENESYKSNLPVKTIYYSGKDSEIITQSLKEKELTFVDLPLVDQFKNSLVSNLADYTKCLILSAKSGSLFIYQQPFKPGLKEITKGKLGFSSFLPKLFLIGLIILFIGVLAYFILNNFSAKETSGTNRDINKIINKIATKSFKPVASGTSKKQASSTASPKSTETVAVNKKEYKINVLNGTTTTGLAGQARDFLVSKGYSDITIGNASTKNYLRTILSIKPSKAAIRNNLTSDLQERYSIDIGSDLAEGDTYDVIIIIGRK